MENLSQKDIDILESYLLYDTQNIEDGSKEIELFVDILLTLQTALIESKIEVQNYKYRISTLATKTILNCSSIINLLQGQTLNSLLLKQQFHLIDLPSLYTLARAQLENYLMFDFVYCQPKTEKEIEFRYNNWIYSGLLSRDVFTPITEKAKTQKEKDIRDIAHYRKLIEESEFFKEFTDRQQKKLLNVGDPRLLKGWNELMDLSGIQKGNSKQLFRLLSSHAHTTGLSIINLDVSQIKYSKTNSEGHLIMFISKLLIAGFIVKFKTRFNITETKYNSFSDNTLNKIDFYSKILTSEKTISA